MKIALIIFQFSESRGGVERFCAEFARGLVRRGHEVHILAHRASTSPPPGAVLHEVPVQRWTSWLKHLTFAAAAERIVRSQSFDVVQTFARTTRQDVVRVGGGSHRAYLRAVGGDGDGLWGRLRRWFSLHDRAILHLEGESLRPGNYRKVVCVSEQCRREILKDYRLPPDDVVVIRNGVNLDRFTPANRDSRCAETRRNLGARDGDTVFLFAGSGFRRKGLRFAIEGLARLGPEARARLWVLGHGEFGRFRRQASRLDLKDRVFFLGRRDQVEPVYAAADAFVFPTLYDPFPNACLEALACGLPLILSRCAGVAELMTDGTEGFLLDDPRDADAVAAAMRKLLDPALRERMAAAARRTAETRSPEACLNEYLNVFEDVMKLKHANGGQ